MICDFCKKNKSFIIEKNNLHICNDCVELFVNTFINNGINIKLKVNNFKIKEK